MASSGAAIITDNILLVKSRCNWLFETMNSNPRLVTVGGTITSQIHDVRDDCQSYIYRQYYPTLFPIANALITHSCAHTGEPLLSFPKRILNRVFAHATRPTSSIRSIRFYVDI